MSGTFRFGEPGASRIRLWREWPRAKAWFQADLRQYSGVEPELCIGSSELHGRSEGFRGNEPRLELRRKILASRERHPNGRQGCAQRHVGDQCGTRLTKHPSTHTPGSLKT